MSLRSGLVMSVNSPSWTDVEVCVCVWSVCLFFYVLYISWGNDWGRGWVIYNAS